MYNQPSGKKEIIRRSVTYSLMTVAVLVLVVFLVMTMLGYRFNQSDGSLVQGGLVQFASQPSGAQVLVDDQVIRGNTTAKATLEPGEHSITMRRDGYRDWTRQIDVRAGTVTWLNYARLIPEEIKPQNVREFNQLDDSLASANGRWFAFLADSSEPEIVIADLQRNEPEFRELTLPGDAIGEPEGEKEPTFKLSQWSTNGRYLLVEYRYDDRREWLVVDREDASRTRNITTLLSVNATQVEFVDNSGRSFYVLENGNVRLVDLGEATLSRPLISGVKSFTPSLDREKLLTYESVERDGQRDLGYYLEGSNDGRPVVIRSVEADSSVPLDIAVDKYYDETYIALAVGSRVEILKGNLPSVNTVASLKSIETLELSGDIRQLMIKGGGRFIYALSGSQYATYDLEQQAQYTTRLASEQSNPGLGWLDEYIAWSDFGGELQFYDFDGSNHQKITNVAPGYDVTLSRNGRFLYVIAPLEDGGFSLQQIRLIL